MNPSSVDIKDYLLQSQCGLSWVAGTNLFVGDMPEKPDKCACIFDAGGGSPVGALDLYTPSIQVVLRGNVSDYVDAWGDAWDIYTVLHNVHGEVINGTTYIQVRGIGEINQLGVDKSQRPLLSMNFDIYRS